MSKYKPGLHKDVSAIFNSASLPKGDGVQQPSTAPAGGQQDQISSEIPALKPPAKKAPVPSHMTPTKPKSEQQPKVAKRPKANTAKRSAVQSQLQQMLGQITSKLFAQKPGVKVPAKQKAMAVFVPLLFVIFIFVFIRLFSSPSQKITGPKKPGPGPVQTAAVASKDKLDWKVPDPYPTTLRDPMQFEPVKTFSTGQGQAADVDGLVVKGIVYSEDNPTAVIDDQIVHEGDNILGVVVTKINEKSVEFEVNGKKWTKKVQR